MNKPPTSYSSSKNDAELIKLIKNGSDYAFDALVKYNFNKLYRIAYCILNSHHDAEEVVQDALLKAYQNLSDFRGESLLLTWLSRIVINLACNKYRSNLRSDVSRRSPDESIYTLPKRQLTPQRKLANRELQYLLIKEIHTLPEVLSSALQMRYLEELSYEEIARRQHCGLGTIKSRISRGRKQLIKQLTDRGIIPGEYC